MKDFNYWITRAKAVKVGDEQTAKAYQYLMGRALAVMVAKNGRYQRINNCRCSA